MLHIVVIVTLILNQILLAKTYQNTDIERNSDQLIDESIL
jgi:hypothetical protein